MSSTRSPSAQRSSTAKSCTQCGAAHRSSDGLCAACRRGRSQHAHSVAPPVIPVKRQLTRHGSIVTKNLSKAHGDVTSLLRANYDKYLEAEEHDGRTPLWKMAYEGSESRERPRKVRKTTRNPGQSWVLGWSPGSSGKVRGTSRKSLENLAPLPDIKSTRSLVL